MICDVLVARLLFSREYLAVSWNRIISAAQVNEVAAGFGVNTESLRRWRKSLEGAGLMGLAPVKKGPKRPSLLTDEKAAQIRTVRAGGASLRATAEATGVSTDTVRRVMAMTTTADAPATSSAHDAVKPHNAGGQLALPVLPTPVPRTAERAAARAGLLDYAPPAFAPAARVRHSGLLLELPHWKQPPYYPARRRCTGRCRTGFTASRRS